MFGLESIEGELWYLSFTPRKLQKPHESMSHCYDYLYPWSSSSTDKVSPKIRYYIMGWLYVQESIYGLTGEFSSCFMGIWENSRVPEKKSK